MARDKALAIVVAGIRVSKTASPPAISVTIAATVSGVWGDGSQVRGHLIAISADR